MNIHSITIQNFRNIGPEKTFHLNPNFTAFIGVNGKGKSTILYALRVAAGAYFLAIPETKRRHIHKDEIRIVESGKFLSPQFPVKIEARGTLPGISEAITWRRQWLEYSTSTTSNNTDIGAIKNIVQEKHHRVNKEHDDTVDLPIIAFFGISRAVGAGRVTQKSRTHRLGRRIFNEGYQDWEEMKAVKFHYGEWLATYDALMSQGKEYLNTKQAFLNAVKTANPFITQIEFYNGELWIKIKIEEEESSLLPLSLHSDGIHYFTAMIAEIAYRCVVLNGFRNESAIKETKGIILIDEIDLHLHPKWQRHVVTDLKDAFPNIQFVVTTHSPFIIQSLEQTELINLDDEERKAFAPNELPINKVITEIMDVETKSDDFEKRYENAKKELEKLENSEPGKTLTTDDYVEISKIIGKVLKDETNDPALKAYLEKQKDEE